MSIPVKKLSEWEERVSQLTPGETAKTLSAYEVALVALCGSHNVLIQGLASRDLPDEVAGFVAGWANQHALLIENLADRLTRIAEPTEALR